MTQGISILPIYDFSPTVNAAYLKKILPLITRYQVAANPVNYAIFYDYVLENNPGLTEAVEGLLADGKAFDFDTSMALYGEHICNTSLDSFEDINKRLHNVITGVSDSLSDTRCKAEETNDSFQKKTAILENIPEASPIKTILQEIIQETQSLAVSTQTLQKQLQDAHTEMEQLRSELAQVREAAITDGLTGLLNRRGFDQLLSELTTQESPDYTHLALLDIDHFKRVNDTYGHTIGDNVIKYVAALMKKHALPHHHVARYGGEELAVIMPNTSREQALAISENIRGDMEKSRLKRKTDNTPLGIITLSTGVAELRSEDSVENFISRADKALYQAKNSGRNQVIYAEFDEE